MSSGRFDVILTGRLVQTRPVAEVHAALAELFSMSVGQVVELLASAPVTVRSGLDYDTARKYRLAIEQAGALCDLREEGGGARVPAGGAGVDADFDAPAPVGGPIDIRTCDPGEGIAWWGAAWRLFKGAWLVWVVMFVIYGVSLGVVSFVPLLGMVAAPLLSTVLLGGFLLAADTQARGGETPRIGLLFAGFERAPGPLLALGAIYLGLSLLMAFGVGLLLAVSGAGGGMMGGMPLESGPAPMMTGGGMLLVWLIVIAVQLPVYAALWFAPALVVLRGCDVPTAIKLSFFGCLRNWLSLLVYGVVMIPLAILCVVTFGLGVLVVGPLFVLSVHSSYRGIFSD